METESRPMTGGHGTYSYTKNSNLQRRAANSARTKVLEAIEEKLDLKQVLATSTTLKLADLGCSVGPNTFIAMDTVVEAVERKCTAQGLALEFQVLFNDHSSNDFNTLFSSLPTGRKYFAAGVPGSFHGRLFPESSLHFVHSSYSLQWLSKVPVELLDKTSVAWNKGRIHYANGPREVAEVYSAQYARDLGVFLEARAKELVLGGLLLLIVPAIDDLSPSSCTPPGILFHLLGSSLMDMAKEGLVSEDEVDSFNLPVYDVSEKEMRELVEINGCFSIERMELANPKSSIDSPMNMKELAMHLRSGLEGAFSKHFGDHIIDQVFDRFVRKAEEFSQQLNSSSRGRTQLFVVLRRI